MHSNQCVMQRCYPVIYCFCMVCLWF